MRDATSTMRDRRGGTLVIVAIAMAAILGMLALAIDLGMGFTARSEAQRIADAAALAAGSAFLDLKPADAVPIAEARAYDYALRNSIRGVVVDSSEVTVQVIQAERKVRVWINRNGLATWFARIFGIDALDVGAMAAAEATEAGTARCLKPFALPDVWADADDDANGNRLWDPGENWEFIEADGDRYQRYGEPGDPQSSTATGYGGDWRNGYGSPSFEGDYGRTLDIKLSNDLKEYQPHPSIYLPWVIPEDPNIEACAKGDPQQGRGASAYRTNICSCNTSPVELGVPYDLEPGNMVGPTDSGIEELFDKDPDAFWDWTLNGGKGGVSSPLYGDGLASPRVMKLAMFDPTQIDKGGRQTIEFNNFGLMFLEERSGNKKDPVKARFMYYVGGEGDGETTGSLVLVLRLVE